MLVHVVCKEGQKRRSDHRADYWPGGGAITGGSRSQIVDNRGGAHGDRGGR